MRTEEVLNFYKDKKVLITGNTGFKGCWLTRWMLKLGASVVGVSLNDGDAFFRESKLIEEIKYYCEDIRDPESINRILKIEKPDIVFHMAAQSLVSESYKDPYFTYTTNVTGTLNLLESCRNIDKNLTFINVTTDKCYENKEWVFSYRENDRLGGKDIYSSSKACSEILASSYRRSFQGKMKIFSVRAGNVIGGGDWNKNRLLPDAIRSIINKNKLKIRSPKSIRPWQNVLEPLWGYMVVAFKASIDNDLSYAWNFGPLPDSFKTVEEFCGVLHRFNSDISVEYDDTKSFAESNILKLDIEKARSYLGWKPILSFEEGVELAINWYEKYLNGLNVNTVTVEQIKLFEERLNI